MGRQFRPIHLIQNPFVCDLPFFVQEFHLKDVPPSQSERSTRLTDIQELHNRMSHETSVKPQISIRWIFLPLPEVSAAKPTK
jgi:hypothetical protein